MSTTPQPNGACPAILMGIKELLNPNSPTDLMAPIGGVQAILDPENKKGVTMEQLTDAGEGHQKQVRLMWKQRAIASEITDTKDCDPGTDKPIFEDTFTTNLHNQHVIHLTEAQVRTMCDAYSALVKVPVQSRSSDGASIANLSILKSMAEEILMDLDAFRQTINQNFLEAFALNIGKWKGGDPSKSFTVIKAADHAVVYTGFNIFKQELKKIGANGKALVFGGGNIDLAFEALNIGCCNVAGQDIGAIDKNNFKFYFDDSDMATLLGNANAFGIIMPKSAQMVTYNKYVGNFARPHGLTQRGTMPDPLLPGVSHDIRLVPSTCVAEGWDLFINLDYGFYFAPMDLFKDGDRLYQYNGNLKAIAASA